jgi:hypothetical protein
MLPFSKEMMHEAPSTSSQEGIGFFTRIVTAERRDGRRHKHHHHGASICTTATSSTTTVPLTTSTQTVINHATVHCQHTIAGNRWLEATRYATIAPFAWLISHQPAVLLSQNKPATSQQYFYLKTNQHQP